MQKIKNVQQRMSVDRQRLVMAYRQVVSSVREARSMQSVLEKERQLRRLLQMMQKA